MTANWTSQTDVPDSDLTIKSNFSNNRYVSGAIEHSHSRGIESINPDSEDSLSDESEQANVRQTTAYETDDTLEDPWEETYNMPQFGQMESNGNQFNYLNNSGNEKYGQLGDETYRNLMIGSKNMVVEDVSVKVSTKKSKFNGDYVVLEK